MTEADWWETSWEPGTPPAVGFLIPRAFEAYARVLHPATDHDGNPVPWARVAAQCGTTLHPEAQWSRLAGRADAHDQHQGWPGMNPEEGVLSRPAFGALADVLARHTTTPERTLVAYWVGYGVWPMSWHSLPTVRLVREEYLFSRPLAGVERLCAEAPAVEWATDPGRQSVMTVGGGGTRPTDDELLMSFGAHAWQSPSAWWPADHVWATSNDTDLDSTLVGGRCALVDDLLADDRLEVLPWPVDGSLWSDADTVNR